MKPCPFCGETLSEVMWTDTECDGTALWQVFCQCGALGPQASDPEEAERLWDKRPDTE